MKIILSRKGFDSSHGGCPSPIMPNGDLISLPIPSKDLIKYSDLQVDSNRSYYNLIDELKIKNIDNNSQCHLDPDLRRDVIKGRRNWKPCFGQINQSQTHLYRRGIKEGDLFLFFGWFKQTEIKNGNLQFKKSAPYLHVIFGYLQIGKIMHVDTEKKVPKEEKIIVM
jgi:hypothetical protein